MKTELPAVIQKKYMLIKALSSSWRTIEQLENLSGLSRSQVFRNINKIKAEYLIQIYSEMRVEDSAMVYRILDMGIIDPDRFNLMMNTDVKGKLQSAH